MTCILNLGAALLCAFALGADVVQGKWGWAVVMAFFVGTNSLFVINRLVRSAR